ncbi:MAG: hypothetical protein R3324_11935, partial [Halobacteriales archaeon]|nr:hypothetical protein [Halobacteriales archaeon]
MDRGQTETIGVVLLLAMTIIGTSAVVAFGGTALDEAKLVSQNRGTAHTMTQFDSRAALVALGDSDVQTFSLGNSGEGSYYVDEDAGWINISHYNRSGNGNAEEILNKSLGAVVYETPDSVIAYQGGGVWQGTGQNSTMVSPPEFHYRSATLTFPLIRVVGSDSASGEVDARITPETRGIRVYPHPTRTYAVGPADPYQNPIQEGEVRVTIHSTYYKAWAEYFRTRSSGDLTVHDNNDTVELTLLSTGTLGDFDMPGEGNAVQVRGLGNSHQITNFTISLIDDDG